MTVREGTADRSLALDRRSAAESTRRWSECPGITWGPVRGKARGPASGYCRTCRPGRNCRGHLQTQTYTLVTISCL